MGRQKTVFACDACGQPSPQWAGRCSSCGVWGSLQEAHAPTVSAGSGGVLVPVPLGDDRAEVEARVGSGIPGVDRVLGGGLVPASVTLLAGEPGIGKSTLLLHVLANLSAAGHPCLLVSGEESRAQVAARARRLGLSLDAVSFATGRDLGAVLGAALATRPFLLAVDSIQALRDTGGIQAPGGVSQVRTCTDALVGLAKGEGVAVVLTGHVTKVGDLAGPRALEHAVDAVLTFDGDARSGLRVLAGGKNRFGAEGETAWFEMGPAGLTEIDPTELLASREGAVGAAIALPQSGRRALAVEVQALVASSDGSGRRQATGLDARRFALVAAVLDRTLGLPFGRAELFGASSGGVRIDDPACDLAVAAALASAVSGAAPPQGSAFAGEVALTGRIRHAPGLAQRLAAARAAGCTVAYVPEGAEQAPDGLRVVGVRQLRDALDWMSPPVQMRSRARSA
jgi:DNA repair protein RadA/Sms